MALQWIQDNVQYFGGDSSKVAIYLLSEKISRDCHQLTAVSTSIQSILEKKIV